MRFPERINAYRLQQLVVAMKEGSATIQDRNEIIEGHLRLVSSVTSTISKRYSYDHEDLFSAGLVALTKAVDSIWCGKKILRHSNVTGYIISSVKHRCKDEIEEMCRSLTMPGRTIRKRFNKGINPSGELCPKAQKLNDLEKTIIGKLPPIYQDSLLQNVEDLNIEDLKKRVGDFIYQLLPIPKVMEARGDVVSENDCESCSRYTYVSSKGIPYAIPEYKETMPSMASIEILNKSVSSPIEEAIIKMRMKGMTYEEIGPKVGMSGMNVYFCIARIEERYNRYDSE